MPIEVACGCGKVSRVQDRHVGKRIKCPGCGQAVTVGTAARSGRGRDARILVETYRFRGDRSSAAGWNDRADRTALDDRAEMQVTAVRLSARLPRLPGRLDPAVRRNKKPPRLVAWGLVVCGYPAVRASQSRVR